MIEGVNHNTLERKAIYLVGYVVTTTSDGVPLIEQGLLSRTRKPRCRTA